MAEKKPGQTVSISFAVEQEGAIVNDGVINWHGFDQAGGTAFLEHMAKSVVQDTSDLGIVRAAALGENTDEAEAAREVMHEMRGNKRQAGQSAIEKAKGGRGQGAGPKK